MKGVFEHFEPAAAGFSKKNAYCMASVAELAYADAERCEQLGLAWGFDEVIFFDAHSTQALVMASQSLLILAFRGTEADKLQDLLRDADARLEGGPLGGRVHKGFLGALREVLGPPHGLDVVLADKAPSRALWVTGHSLGAALATLACATMVNDLWAGCQPSALYTFGSPRVGDETFANELGQRLGPCVFRVVHNNDVICELPPPIGYHHVGRRILITEAGELVNDPSSLLVAIDKLKGLAAGLTEQGIDPLVDHKLVNAGDGYVPALRAAIDSA